MPQPIDVPDPWAVGVRGAAQNAAVLSAFSTRIFSGGGLAVAGVLAEIDRVMATVKGGDLKPLEGLLAAQVLALNAIFTDLAYCAAGRRDNLDVMERVLRLGFRAQAQSRAAIETLALLQNGPAVFARQANIAQGLQQVNNGPVVAVSDPSGAPARIDLGRNEVLTLEGAHERVDAGTTAAAGACDSQLAPVAPVDRAANG